MVSALADPHHLRAGHPSERRDPGGISPKHIIVGYGFWLFLVSDIIMFSAFFATYTVLAHATAGGPSPRSLFDLSQVAVETGCLLLSTFTCGLALLAAKHRNVLATLAGLAITGALGCVFLGIELQEFAHMINQGAGPGRSAFLSAFFSLVGCHGAHVFAAILWCGTMMAQFLAKGFQENIQRRMLCFSLFWHALDIVWVGVFTNVYLIGSRA